MNYTRLSIVKYVLAITTCPEDKANDLAMRLVESQACACVNIIRGVVSVYRWKGSIEVDPECLLLIKTTSEMKDFLFNVIKDNHPYEVPEFITLDITGGSTSYLEWISSCVG